MPTLANRNNNPGNLRFIGQTGASQGEGGFARFNTPAEGYAALMNDIQAKVTGKSRSGLKPTDTLVDFTKVYAPASDNNAPGAYAAAVANKLGVRPDVKLHELQGNIPQLAEAIAHHEGYQGKESSSKPSFNPTPFSNPTQGSGLGAIASPASLQAGKTEHQEPGLGQELIDRSNQLGQAVKQGVSGEINPFSSVLQAGGAIAGGLGDVVNAGIGLLGKGVEKVTGYDPVQGVEKLIGQGVGYLAKTPAGQAVSESISQFSKDHPELSADIGAGFNIATAIPILRGLGAAKNVAMDAASSQLMKLAEKGAAKDLTEVLSRNKTGLKLLQQNKGVVDALVKERALPEIVNIGGVDRYSIENAYETLGNKISHLEDNVLQPMLAKGNTGRIADSIPIEQLRKEAIDSIKKEFKGTGESINIENAVNKKFDGFKNEYGDYVTIQDLNDMKRGVRQKVNFNSPALDQNVSFHLGQSFMSGVEHFATKLGAGDVRSVNQEMAKLIKAQKALEAFNNTAVKKGSLAGSLIKAVPGGETAMKVKGIYGTAKKGIQKSVLERTTEGYTPIKGKTALKKIGGLVGAAEAQKANR